MNDTLPYGGTTPYKYHWDFGDGTQTPFRNTTHTYTTTGCNTITLSIQDSTGKTTRTTTAATIKENTTEPYIKNKQPKNDLYFNNKKFISYTNHGSSDQSTSWQKSTQNTKSQTSNSLVITRYNKLISPRLHLDIE